MSVRTENSILIKAPLDRIFEVTSDLLRWPKVLPHYRWIRVLQTDNDGLIVKMAARRGWLPIQWTSRFQADPRTPELRFEHLKAFTRGMKVQWSYTPTPDGVLVKISHELQRASAFGRWFAEHVLGKLFIEPVATRTLSHFKQYLEQNGA
jgi:ribosome-associated toxin RatA of RatAB toxin-antitoxin module